MIEFVLSKSLLLTVKVISVFNLSADIFCTIISTTILFSYNGLNILDSTPGLSFTHCKVIFASSFVKATPVMTLSYEILF